MQNTFLLKYLDRILLFLTNVSTERLATLRNVNGISIYLLIEFDYER